jgi:peptidyl-prolyl cis-trans isomerase B (cyclophilin B)
MSTAESPPPALQPRVPGVNTMAIAGLIFGFLLPPIGIVMAHIAKSQIRRTGESGRGIATAALVVGYSVLFLCACGLPFTLSTLGV